MYILKNAWRSITRSKGRNILIGIILFVIAVSACIALSIGEAAETARQDSEDQLSITGQISVNRQAMMQNQYSKEDKKEAMTNMEELSLDDLKSYADSDYVKSFYFMKPAKHVYRFTFNGINDVGVCLRTIYN